MNFNKEFFLKQASLYTNTWKELTKKLVSFPSVLEEFNPKSDSPFGVANKDALNWMLDYAKKDGFEVLNDQNYAGHVAFGEGSETLGVLAHLDVVPAVGKWTADPFIVIEKDGKLIGRGVNDDKGPLAAAYLAIKLLKDAGFKPNKQVLLIMGCDEESGSRCLTHYFKSHKMPEFGFSPDACFPCINGEKAGVHYNILGKITKDSVITSFNAGERYNIVPDYAKMTLSVDLKTEYLAYLTKNNLKGEVKGDEYLAYGVSAHAMSPEKGVNAAFTLIKFLNEVKPCEFTDFMVNYLVDDTTGSKLGIQVSHHEMKDLTQNVGIIHIENNDIFVGVDLRVPVDGHEQVIALKLEEAVKNTSLSFEMPSVGKTHYVPKDSFLVKSLMDSYRTFTDDYINDAYSIGGGTYAKFIDNAVAFGPQFVGREDVDHQADEYVLIDDYTKAIAIYAMAIYELTK